MTLSKRILENRSMSGFPLSVGTGLALETLFNPIGQVIDETRTPPPKADLTAYTDFLFNVASILRNLLASVNFADLKQTNRSDVIDTFLSEIEFINNFCLTQGLNPVFYVHSYDFPRKTYPDKLRLATSDQQKFLYDITETCLNQVRREDDVIHFTKDIYLTPDSSTLVLTHVPWDLLSYGRFRKLELLESHTGVIKSRKDWNTKYYKVPDVDMSSFPFMEYLLTTFGDNYMFKPAPLKERLELCHSLMKKKVHPLMTETTFSYLR